MGTWWNEQWRIVNGNSCRKCAEFSPEEMRPTASAAVGSAAQLQATQTETYSAHQDVTDTDPDDLIDMPSGSRKRTANEPGDPSY